ncbi:MAG: hypothetical protein H0U27_14410 [Nitrosopumilus sp.]|nr:hypothetical protein [Nitrosopumilus sp.]
MQQIIEIDIQRTNKNLDIYKGDILENFNYQNYSEFWDHYDQLMTGLNDQHNPFSKYLTGFFILSHANYTNTLNQERINAAKAYLDPASKDNYLRATNFLQDNFAINDQQYQLELNERQNKILKPEKLLLRFIEEHDAKASTTPEDIRKFRKNAFQCLSGDIKKYEDIYIDLSNELTGQLSKRIKEETTYRTLGIILIYQLLNSVFIDTQGILSIAKGDLLSTVLGSLQVTAGTTSVIAATATSPFFANFIYGYQWQGLSRKHLPISVNLLPSSYSVDEISNQSKLVTLYYILLNKDVIQQHMSGRWCSYWRTGRQLRHMILSSFRNDEDALSNFLLNSNIKLKIQGEQNDA